MKLPVSVCTAISPICCFGCRKANIKSRLLVDKCKWTVQSPNCHCVYMNGRELVNYFGLWHGECSAVSSIIDLDVIYSDCFITTTARIAVMVHNLAFKFPLIRNNNNWMSEYESENWTTVSYIDFGMQIFHLLRFAFILTYSILWFGF